MSVPYGKYLLERKLAEGGMAEIFLARHSPPLGAASGNTLPPTQPNPQNPADRRGPIVIKRLFSHHSAEKEFVRMFFNEARLAARLKHRNIVDIFDQGENEGTYYLAMEFIAGEDLRSIAQQADVVGKRPPLSLVCRIIVDMLAGLHYAHTLNDDEGRLLVPREQATGGRTAWVGVHRRDDGDYALGAGWCFQRLGARWFVCKYGNFIWSAAPVGVRPIAKQPVNAVAWA